MQMATFLHDALIFMFCILKGEMYMTDMYLALVMAGRRTCNPDNKKVRQVPAKYRAAVLADLEALGLDADGNPVEDVSN